MLFLNLIIIFDKMNIYNSLSRLKFGSIKERDSEFKKKSQNNL